MEQLLEDSFTRRKWASLFNRIYTTSEKRSLLGDDNYRLSTESVHIIFQSLAMTGGLFKTSKDWKDLQRKLLENGYSDDVTSLKKLMPATPAQRNDAKKDTESAMTNGNKRTVMDCHDNNETQTGIHHRFNKKMKSSRMTKANVVVVNDNNENRNVDDSISAPMDNETTGGQNNLDSSFGRLPFKKDAPSVIHHVDETGRAASVAHNLGSEACMNMQVASAEHSGHGEDHPTGNRMPYSVDDTVRAASAMPDKRGSEPSTTNIKEDASSSPAQGFPGIHDFRSLLDGVTGFRMPNFVDNAGRPTSARPDRQGLEPFTTNIKEGSPCSHAQELPDLRRLLDEVTGFRMPYSFDDPVRAASARPDRQRLEPSTGNIKEGAPCSLLQELPTLDDVVRSMERIAFLNHFSPLGLGVPNHFDSTLLRYALTSPIGMGSSAFTNLHPYNVNTQNPAHGTGLHSSAGNPLHMDLPKPGNVATPSPCHPNQGTSITTRDVSNESHDQSTPAVVHIPHSSSEDKEQTGAPNYDTHKEPLIDLTAHPTAISNLPCRRGIFTLAASALIGCWALLWSLLKMDQERVGFSTQAIGPPRIHPLAAMFGNPKDGTWLGTEGVACNDMITSTEIYLNCICSSWHGVVLLAGVVVTLWVITTLGVLATVGALSKILKDKSI